MGFCLSVVPACQVAVECQASASITGSFLHRQTKGVKRRSIEVTSNGAQQRIKSPTMPTTSHARYHKVNKLQQSRFFQFTSKTTYALLKALCVLIRVSTCLFVYLLAHENRSSVDQVDDGLFSSFQFRSSSDSSFCASFRKAIDVMLSLEFVRAGSISFVRAGSISFVREGSISFVREGSI